MTDAGNNRVTCHHFQNHDEARDGRVFVCENCGNQRCVRCGVREHKGETCVEFRARLDRDHGKEEEKTAQSFRDGYEGKEVVGEGKKERWKWKHPKPCTSCGQMIEKDGRCDHMTCELFLKRQRCPPLIDERCAMRKRVLHELPCAVLWQR